ncbi:MAG TPA: ThiF family adenylyltransferase [Anaerovoracaceae bacterium]|nr:ThiF family adenylyltransferase [Anaerovoracaceae bacterium]
MKNLFEKTQMLLGAKTLNMIKMKKVIIFGVGGAGGSAAEALVRSGIQTIAVVDCGTVDLTDIGVQVIALHSTVGRKKAEVMEERIKDINPDAAVKAYGERLTPDNIEIFRLSDYDYIVDAIDDIPAKLLLIQSAVQLNVPIISAMSTGNKFNPSMLKIGDIKWAGACPMAAIIRKETAKIGVRNLKVVYSTETPHREELPEDGSRSPSGIAFVPAAAGLLTASEVIRDFLYTAPSERRIFGIKFNAPGLKADEF